MQSIFSSVHSRFIDNLLNRKRVHLLKIDFKPFAYIMSGISLIGFSIGFIVGFYIHAQLASYFYMYAAAPCLGIGSGLVIYGTLYGREK